MDAPITARAPSGCAQVPSWARSRTPLTLYATAGLRLLRPATAGAILESCRGALLGGPFRFQREWASVLSGTNEGLYGWVAANYGAGRLAEMARSARGRQQQQQPARQRGLAVAEMGGASAQVTFVLDDASRYRPPLPGKAPRRRHPRAWYRR